MVNQDYVPKQGDIIAISFNPQAGHEQMGTKPALVLSPENYNRITNLAIICPITGKIKGYPFEVTLPESLKTRGVILADQVKNMDWKARGARFIEAAPHEVLNTVIEKLTIILKFEK